MRQGAERLAVCMVHRHLFSGEFRNGFPVVEVVGEASDDTGSVREVDPWCRDRGIGKLRGCHAVELSGKLVHRSHWSADCGGHAVDIVPTKNLKKLCEDIASVFYGSVLHRGIDGGYIPAYRRWLLSSLDSAREISGRNAILYSGVPGAGGLVRISVFVAESDRAEKGAKASVPDLADGREGVCRNGRVSGYRQLPAGTGNRSSCPHCLRNTLEQSENAGERNRTDSISYYWEPMGSYGRNED